MSNDWRLFLFIYFYSAGGQTQGLLDKATLPLSYAPASEDEF